MLKERAAGSEEAVAEGKQKRLLRKQKRVKYPNSKLGQWCEKRVKKKDPRDRKAGREKALASGTTALQGQFQAQGGATYTPSTAHSAGAGHPEGWE